MTVKTHLNRGSGSTLLSGRFGGRGRGEKNNEVSNEATVLH